MISGKETMLLSNNNYVEVYVYEFSRGDMQPLVCVDLDNKEETYELNLSIKEAQKLNDALTNAIKRAKETKVDIIMPYEEGQG